MTSSAHDQLHPGRLENAPVLNREDEQREQRRR